MIINNKEIESVKANGYTIGYIRFMGHIVYEAVRSCFGKGVWISRLGWRNKDNWKNN